VHEPSTDITYQVHYQPKGKTDWYVMTGRDHDERYRNGVVGGVNETASMDEAVETAEALVRGLSHPKDPEGPYRTLVTAACVITIIRASQVSAVYGEPSGDVPREP
jgi:hypothetical protein